MDKVWPWVRSVIGFALGMTAINVVNAIGAEVFPHAYAAIDTDAARITTVVVAMLAGIVGSFVLGAVARHRLWLHMVVFGLVMLAIDTYVLLGPLAGQPVWFKVLVIGTLPLQIWVGGRLAALTWRGYRAVPAT